MRVLMFGRGVITTIYGWALSQAGHEIRFLIRPGKSRLLGGKVALDIIDARLPARRQGVQSDMDLTCVESLADLAEYDLVLVSVRHNQMREAAEQLAAARRPRGGILFFNNCWDDPASVTSSLEGSPVLWGFPVAGGGFTDNHRLSGAIMPNVHLAQATPENAGLHAQTRLLFESAGLKVEEHADFRAWLWLHFAVNAGMVSQALVHQQSAEQLVSSVRDLAHAARLSKEAVRVVYARGVSPSSHRAETAITTMPPFLAGLIVKNLAHRNAATRRLMTVHTDESSLARFPLDVLAEARRLQVACPGLEQAEAPALASLEAASLRVKPCGQPGPRLTCAPSDL